MSIKNGDFARDTITGFEGIVVATTDWLYGCRRLTLQPKAMHDGKPIEPQTFDEPQLELVSKEEVKGKNDTGGPRPEPVRRSNPGMRA